MDIDEKERLEKIEADKAKFAELLKKSVDDQAEFFVKSFIFELGEDWKEVNKLAAAYKAAIKDSGSTKNALSQIAAGQFLQAHSAARTGLERKRECQDIDLNSDGMVSFVEFLLLHYKAMILTSYYKRMKKEPEEDLSKGGVGLTGVGLKLLDELLEIPLNLDPELVKAMDDLKLAKKNRLKKIQKLEAKAAKGGVLGKAAANELEQFLAKPNDKIKRLELTLAAARKKNLKHAETAGRKIKAEKAKADAEKKSTAKAKRNAFAARAKMFEQS